MNNAVRQDCCGVLIIKLFVPLIKKKFYSSLFNLAVLICNSKLRSCRFQTNQYKTKELNGQQYC